MPEEEVGLRLALKNRRETVAGIDDVDSRIGRLGRTAEASGRRASSGARGIERLTGGIRNLGSVTSTALIGGVAAAGYTAVKVTKGAITEASNLNESLNAVNVTYSKQAAAVKKLGRQAAVSKGLSNVDYNSLAVQFGSFVKTIAGPRGGPAVGKTLNDLTTRASDFASVMNLEVSDSAALFQSGLAGESEPLRRYGIDLSAAAVSAYAYANGIAAAGAKLTAGQKVQAAYGSLMKQTAQTQGDFVNTSDQLANSQRILGARWDNAKAKLGVGLLPVLTDAVRFLNRDGIPVFNQFARQFNREGVPTIKRWIDQARPLAKQVLPAVSTGFNSVRDAAKDVVPVVKTIRDVAQAVGPHLREAVDVFNGAPDWLKKAIVGGGAAVAISKRLGLPSLGKAAFGLANRNKPLPVFVTNPGFGGEGGGKGILGKVGKAAPLAGLGATAVTAAAAAALVAAPIYAGVKTRRLVFGDDAVNRADRRSREQLNAVGRDARSHMGVAEMQGPNLGIGQYVQAMNGATRSRSADYFKAIEGGASSAGAAVKLATDNTGKLGVKVGQVDGKRVNVPVTADTRGALTALDTIERYRLTPKVQRVLMQTGNIFGLGTVAGAALDDPAPASSGRVVPRAPQRRPAPPLPATAGEPYRRGGYDGSTPIQFALNGRVLSEATLDDLAGQGARK